MRRSFLVLAAVSLVAAAGCRASSATSSAPPSPDAGPALANFTDTLPQPAVMENASTTPGTVEVSLDASPAGPIPAKTLLFTLPPAHSPANAASLWARSNAGAPGACFYQVSPTGEVRTGEACEATELVLDDGSFWKD
jgi:hypothetical protein